MLPVIVALVTIAIFIESIVCANGDVSNKLRALEMLSKMVLSEKLEMLHGYKGTYVGNVRANERLGIPPLHMQDGPQGFRVTNTTGIPGSTTAWPSAMTVTASWDSNLVYRWASAMAEEFQGKGANIALSLGLGIARVPTAGRNFEYICGEDPYFGAQLAGPIVRGFHDKGILVNAKHWVNNEIEDDRRHVSSNVDERTRFEIYYPPFAAAVQAGVLSVMCAYNRVNDVYACENSDTFAHLRNDLHFEGWVMSDWLATKSTTPSVIAGLDQEMPLGIHYNNQVMLAALAAKKISLKEIDDKVYNILYSMYSIGLFDTAPVGNPLANVTSAAHNDLAREISAKSTILIQNNNQALPLNLEELTSTPNSCIAVFGDEDTISGGGSGHVDAAYIVTPFQGISAAVDGKVPILYASGEDLSEARTLAAQCTVSVVVVAITSSEGSDRESLSLGDAQNELVSTVAAANTGSTVVNVRTPGAVLLPWASSVTSILISGLPGQEAGNGLADVLFGRVNPSARLSYTLPNTENEMRMTPKQYPGVGKPPDATYIEDLEVGYRWYNAHQVRPAFAFGHGLSYTTFKYSQLHIALKSEAFHERDTSAPNVEVSFVLTNTGAVSGNEVSQLYLTFPAESGEPPVQLKGFTKVLLDSSAEQTITFPLYSRDLSVWNVELRKWKLVTGEFSVFVGASSVELPLKGIFKV